MRDQVWFVILIGVLAVVLPPLTGAAAAVFARYAGLGRAAMIGTFGAVAAFTFGAILAMAMLIATLWPSCQEAFGCPDRAGADRVASSRM